MMVWFMIHIHLISFNLIIYLFIVICSIFLKSVVLLITSQLAGSGKRLTRHAHNLIYIYISLNMNVKSDFEVGTSFQILHSKIVFVIIIDVNVIPNGIGKENEGKTSKMFMSLAGLATNLDMLFPDALNLWKKLAFKMTQKQGKDPLLLLTFARRDDRGEDSISALVAKIRRQS